MTEPQFLVSVFQRLLKEPSPDDLWLLQPYLLASGTLEAEAARDIAGQFYAYLSQVHGKLTSKEYSTLAATFAAGAVGAFSVQELVNALRDDRANAVRHFLVGGLAGTLEMLSTIQHVKVWEKEFSTEHDLAVWNLYAAWWQLSCETQPELARAERAAHLNRLLAPARDAQLNGMARLGLVLYLFQTLLAIRLVPLFSAELFAAHGE